MSRPRKGGWDHDRPPKTGRPREEARIRSLDDREEWDEGDDDVSDVWADDEEGTEEDEDPAE